MKDWQSLLRLARFRLGWYLLSGVLASTVFYLFPLVPGLLVRRFLNELTTTGPSVGVHWGLLIALIAVAITRALTMIASLATEITVQLTVSALLRQNLLQHILRRPGAQALPASAGEAISRFRDDVQFVVGFLTWSLDPVGQIIVFAVALAILNQWC